MRNLCLILLACSAGILTSCDKHQKRETKYPNGQVEEQFSVLETENGSFVKDGEYKKWYSDGQTESSGAYDKGKQTGNWKHWHNSGQLKKDCTMRMDSLDGSFVSWFPSGQKEMDGKYNMGQKAGPWLEWHENGQKACEENYAEGVREGDMKFWDSKGKLCGFRTFQKGVDLSLPAVYKIKGGAIKLELAADGKYEYTYPLSLFSMSRFKAAKSGKFEVSNKELNLIGYKKFPLKKYTQDTVEFETSDIFGQKVTFELVKRQPLNAQQKQK